MRQQKRSRVSRWVVSLLVIMTTTGAAAGLWWYRVRLAARKAPAEQYVLTDVRRADLFPRIRASGRVQSSKRTTIECELERFDGGHGQGGSSGGASVVLQLVPEGTRVKKGDVLAVLDSSDYVEMVRVQEINVEQARAGKLQAELDHEIARLALTEFRDGTMKETIEDFRQRIMLGHADVERARDRLRWTHSMKDKGYLSAGTVKTDEFTLAQIAAVLEQDQGAMHVFQKYTAPKTIRELEGVILGAEANLDYEILRLQQQENRLARLREQVALCTIRAPHDGYVIYANNPRSQIFIEEGMPVRQSQKLFYLPDLASMEVLALLSESVVDLVRAGQPAVVTVEGLPDRTMHGRVTKVAHLALPPDWQSDTHYFEGIVTIDDPAPKLMPGMTAQVEVEIPPHEHVLAVPPEAVASDDGRDVCFVVHGDNLERREVTLGQVTEDLTEVTAGLREGEQVVLNPDPDELEIAAATTPAPSGGSTGALDAAAAATAAGEVASSH
ncbi:MAG: efflux RND transporter periplasmic adaptor subunit [Isosphaeraceae bacterium]